MQDLCPPGTYFLSGEWVLQEDKKPVSGTWLLTSPFTYSVFRNVHGNLWGPGLWSCSQGTQSQGSCYSLLCPVDGVSIPLGKAWFLQLSCPIGSCEMEKSFFCFFFFFWVCHHYLSHSCYGHVTDLLLYTFHPHSTILPCEAGHLWGSHSSEREVYLVKKQIATK